MLHWYNEGIERFRKVCGSQSLSMSAICKIASWKTIIFHKFFIAEIQRILSVAENTFSHYKSTIFVFEQQYWVHIRCGSREDSVKIDQDQS